MVDQNLLVILSKIFWGIILLHCSGEYVVKGGCHIARLLAPYELIFIIFWHPEVSSRTLGISGSPKYPSADRRLVRCKNVSFYHRFYRGYFLGNNISRNSMC